MIPAIWFTVSGLAIVGTWFWARCGGFDPWWRIVFHVLSLVTYCLLWIADIILQMQ
jgi:hypothetical protein